MSEWYYAKADQQFGPVTTQDLQAMVADGRVQAADLIWTEGLADWTPAGRVQAVFAKNAAQISAASPPPPMSRVGQARAAGTIPRCHEINYEVFGDDMQVVEIELDPNETVIAEAGAMNYMDDGIVFEAKMGDGSKPNAGVLGKLFEGAKRVVTGESLFLTHFTNPTGSPKRVAVAAPYPGKVIATDLCRMGGEILCQKDAFLCAAYGTEVGIAFTRRLGTGFFGGEGFILQRLRGDGMVFIHAGGHIIRKELDGGCLKVDTGCMVGFTPGVK